MLAIFHLRIEPPAMTNWFAICASGRKTQPVLGKERRLASVALQLK